MNARLRSLILLIIAQIAFGSAAIFVRYALTATGPINATFFRVLIAAPLALALASFARKPLRFTRQQTIRLVAAGSILGLHFVLWIVSLAYTSVMVATLLVCTAPFWLAIYDAIIRHKLPTRATGLAFIVAAVAASVVVFSGPIPTSSGSNSLVGAALAVAAALLFCIYLTLMRSVRDEHSTLSLIAYAYPSTLIVLGPVALVAHEPLPATILSWAGILGMAIVAQLIGHTALAASLRSFSSRTVAFAGLSEPPISAVAAAILLGEPIGLAAMVAGVAVLGAIAVVLADDSSGAPDELLVLESSAL